MRYIAVNAVYCVSFTLCVGASPLSYVQLLCLMYCLYKTRVLALLTVLLLYKSLLLILLLYLQDLYL